MTTLNNPVFVWVTDIHINSKQALFVNHEVDLGDDNYYKPNKMQEALYIAWIDAWRQVKQKAKGRPIVVGIGGEIIDIDAKNRSNQFVTKDPSQAQEYAIELLEPVIDMASSVIVLRGTEAHVGMNGAQDEAMAKLIDKMKKGVIRKNKITGEYSWHYYRGFIGGRKFDLAHHVNMGGMPRTERNAANHLAADLMMNYSRWNEPLPDFAFRGHVHRVADSSFNYPVRGLIGACWQVATSFVHRIGQGATKPEIGLFFCDIAKKEVEYIGYDFKREAPDHI